jgi:hypothetical protein
MLLFRTHQTNQAEKERALAAALNKEATQTAKTQLKLAMPESVIAQ